MYARYRKGRKEQMAMRKKRLPDNNSQYDKENVQLAMFNIQRQVNCSSGLIA